MPLSDWVPLSELDMSKLEELIRMANLGQRVAFAKVYGAFNKVEKYK